MAISTTFTLKFAGSAVEKGLARVKSAFKSLGGLAAKTGKMLLSPFAALTAMLGAGALAASMATFISSSSMAAASIEDLTMQFETLTKSASITKSLLDDFRKEAAKSPLSIEDYAKAGKTLMAFGMEANDVMPTLKNLADVSMGNADRFASLSLAFAQTSAAGRLMGQEVLQFINAGFNPLQQISKKTGETMGQLKKRMEDGGISALEVSQAFREATAKGGLFFEAIEKGADTTSGKIAKTKDAILGVQIAFGTGFNDGLKVALDSLDEGIPKLQGKATELGKLFGMAIEETVNGDTKRLVMIGELIGDLILSGVKISLNGLTDVAGQKFLEMQEDIPVSGVGAVSKMFGLAEMHEQGAEVGRERMIRESAESITQKYRQAVEMPPPAKQGPVPGAPGYRYAQHGEPATIMGDERVVRILETIERNLAPVP